MDVKVTVLTNVLFVGLICLQQEINYNWECELPLTESIRYIHWC